MDMKLPQKCYRRKLWPNASFCERGNESNHAPW